MDEGSPKAHCSRISSLGVTLAEHNGEEEKHDKSTGGGTINGLRTHKQVEQSLGVNSSNAPLENAVDDISSDAVSPMVATTMKMVSNNAPDVPVQTIWDGNTSSSGLPDSLPVTTTVKINTNSCSDNSPPVCPTSISAGTPCTAAASPTSSITTPSPTSSLLFPNDSGDCSELAEVNLHDEESSCCYDNVSGSSASDKLHLGAPLASGDAINVPSELGSQSADGRHQQDKTGSKELSRPALPNGLRVDVEMETRLFNLTDRVTALTDENKALAGKLKCAEEDNQRLMSENSKERSHIETLEGQLTNLRAELDAQREAAAGQARSQQEATRALEVDLTSRLSRTRAQFEAALRDKDKMVLRYAQSEKSVIDAKREAAAAERRVKEVTREKDMLVSKVNHMVQERNRLSQQMEAKNQEAKTLAKDSGKLKEEVESRDVRIKWLQNKMKQEADSYKDGQLRMETLLRELREAQETIRQYKLTEDNRSSALDKELRQEKARRMVEEKLKQDSTNKEQALTAQLQDQQERCSQLAQHSAANLERALTAEAALEPLEASKTRLQEEVAALRHQVETLLHDSAELDEIRATLGRERERLTVSQAEVDTLRTAQVDLQADLDGCHAKEADLLDFTQKLTEKNVELQSQVSGLLARSQAAELEVRQFNSCRSDLEGRLSDVTARLAREQEARSTDNQLLARRLAEKTHQVEALTRRAEDAENETAIVKKKHQSSIRELQRELAQARRRQECQDASPAPTPADRLSQGSRASSNVSLHETPVEPPPVVQVAAPVEPDRQALIERIVRLQRQVARRSEKIDFLEDHVNSLVEEVRRKSRLLQHYMLREEAGALASQDRDQAKTDLMKKGGIMASVYGSHSKDQAMTLELSLEINKKLQTVLEDTLLKNMTLKDNMNVLGEEIASLTEQNRQLKRQ